MKRRDFFKYAGLTATGFINVDSLLAQDLEECNKRRLQEIAQGFDEFAKAGLRIPDQYIDLEFTEKYSVTKIALKGFSENFTS